MNKQALEKLRDFLLATPVPFQMMYWHINTKSSPDPDSWELLDLVKTPRLNRGDELCIDSFNHTCGTAACAAGWSTYITPPTEECFCEDGLLQMDVYIENILGLQIGTEEEQYLFAGHWSSVDNTRHGAAYRLDQFLNNPEAAEIALMGSLVSYSLDDESDEKIKQYLANRDTWLAQRGVTL